MIESPAGGKRELRRQLLIDVNAEPGGFRGVHITIPDLGASLKDFARLGRENIPLVDAEVVARQLESESGCVSQGGDVSRTMPRRFDAEKFAERRHLSRHRQAADLRDVNPDKVDQAVCDQGHILMLRVEKLPHRQRDAGLLPQNAKVVVFFRRQGILQEKEAVFFQFFT